MHVWVIAYIVCMHVGEGTQSPCVCVCVSAHHSMSACVWSVFSTPKSKISLPSKKSAEHRIFNLRFLAVASQ